MRIVLSAKDLKRVTELAGYGLPEAMIAHVLGMSAATLRRKKVNERVVAAIEKGKATAQGKVGGALYRRAIKGDVAAIRWYEMTRAGRSEKSRHEVEDVTPIDKDQLLDRFMAKLGDMRTRLALGQAAEAAAARVRTPGEEEG